VRKYINLIISVTSLELYEANTVCSTASDKSEEAGRESYRMPI